MYAPFVIKVDELRELPWSSTDTHVSRREVCIDGCMQFVDKKNGTIDAEQLRQYLFPTTSMYDVFISHSHEDADAAINLAVWLEQECNLRCFVDSQIWAHVDSLLEQMEEKARSQNQRELDEILRMSILQAIVNSHFVFFLQSPHAIDDNLLTTHSPWLNMELNMITILPQESYKTKEIVGGGTGHIGFLVSEDVYYKVNFPVNLSRFIRLSEKDLLTLKMSNNSSLDKLYSLANHHYGCYKTTH